MKEDHEKEIAELNRLLLEAQSNLEVHNLEEQFQKLKNERETAINQFLGQSKNELQQIESKISQENSSHPTILAKLNDELEKLNKDTETQIQELNSKIEQEKEDHQKRVNLLQKDNRNEMANIRDEHEKAKMEMEVQIQQLKVQKEKEQQEFQAQIVRMKAERTSTMIEYEKSKNEEFEKSELEFNAMIDFYDERISVLKKQLAQVQLQFENRPPRPQEVALIEQLQGQLQTVTYQLQNYTKDILEYRGMLGKKEKEFNKRFGNKPKVGVFSTAPKNAGTA